MFKGLISWPKTNEIQVVMVEFKTHLLYNLCDKWNACLIVRSLRPLCKITIII